MKHKENVLKDFNVNQSLSVVKNQNNIKNSKMNLN